MSKTTILKDIYKRHIRYFTRNSVIQFFGNFKGKVKGYVKSRK